MNSPPSPNSVPSNEPDSLARVLIFASGFGLTFGAVTLMFEFTAHSSAARHHYYGVEHFTPVFSLFAASSALLYFVFASLVGRLLRLRFSVLPAPFLVATFFALLVGWTFTNWRELLYYTPAYQRHRVVFITAFMLITWRLVYIGVRPLYARPKLWNFLAWCGRFFPFLSLMAAYWFWNDKVRAAGAASGVGVTIALAVFSFVTLFSFARRLSPRIFPAGFLCLLTPLVFVAPLLEPYISGRKLLLSNHRPSSEHPIPRVIILSIDTLRADALGTYSGEAAGTPHLDALAADSVVFENAFSSSSWTYPALSSIMTGVSPWTHKTIKIMTSLPDELETLAESLSNAGYHANAIGANPLLIPALNLTQGFKDYDFFPRPRPFGSVPSRLFNFLFNDYFPTDADTEELATRSIDWMDKNAKNDFFLWHHFYDPHGPYKPPPEFYPKGEPENFDFSDERLGPALVRAQAQWSPSIPEDANFEPSPEKDWIHALYTAEVHYVDANVGRMIQALKDRGLYDDTLIIVTADHGEEFWEHGIWGHGHTLYNELIRVPLFVKMPGSSVKGRRDAYVTTQSIAATICELLGIESAIDQYEAGSLVDLLSVNEELRKTYAEKPIFSMGLLYGKNQRSVIVDTYKYAQTAKKESDWLFDLEADPLEKVSLVASEPELAESLDQLLRYQGRRAAVRRQALGLGEKGSDIEMNPQTLEKLRELGYIQ